MPLEQKEITFRIRRYKPGEIDPPRFQAFRLAVNPHMTVLDALEQIRLQQDPSLMYRHSCHHSSCGTCACVINGQEALACTTNVWQLGVDVITLEPLKGFAPIGDLVVDMTAFYGPFQNDWNYLKAIAIPAEGTDTLPAHNYMRFENCIECGCCVSACPPSRETPNFIGPAALSAIHNEIKKEPQKKEALLALAEGNWGERHCRRHLACSRVCPVSVYPAKHISDLRKMLASNQSETGFHA